MKEFKLVDELSAVARKIRLEIPVKPDGENQNAVITSTWAAFAIAEKLTDIANQLDDVIKAKEGLCGVDWAHVENVVGEDWRIT